MDSGRWKGYGCRVMHRVGGVSALAVALLLLPGVAGLAVSSAGLGLRNWLVVLFQMHSGVGSLPAEPLHVLNCLDVVILILVALTFVGLWPGPSPQHRVWTAIAGAVPLLGIPVLLLTELAGRSTVMVGGIIVAVLILAGRASVATTFESLGMLPCAAEASAQAAQAYARGGRQASARPRALPRRGRASWLMSATSRPPERTSS